MNVSSLRIKASRYDEKVSTINLLQLTDDGFSSPEAKQQINLINSSKSTEQQLKEIKSLAKLITPDRATDENERIATTLLKIYFKEKVKHPAKSTIQSCFNQTHDQSLIISCIKNELDRQISIARQGSNESSYHLIGCLNEASQNFNPAIKAMGEKVNDIIKFIKNVIEIYDEVMRTEISPAQKNEVSHRIHCGLQVIIFCVKSYFNNTNGIDMDLKRNLDEIVAKCVVMLDYPDLPMDTKNNCAMLIVMYSKLNLDYTFVDWISNDQNSEAKKLAIIFGVVNTLNSSSFDFEQLVKVTTVLQDIFMQSSVDPSIMLSVSRSLMQVTKKLETAQVLTEAKSHQRELDAITSSALTVSFLNLEHHVDSVRHLSRDTIRNVVSIGVKLGYASLIDRIFCDIRKLPSINLKSIVVLSISPLISAKHVIEKMPKFNESLIESISDNKVTNHNLMNCYEALGIQHLNEPSESFFHQCEKVVEPVLREMAVAKCELKSEEYSILESLLMRFVQKDFRVFDVLLEMKIETGFILRCYSVGKKAGRYDENVSTAEKWKGQIEFSKIKSVMIDADEYARTSAFMLIVESRRTTEGFDDQELDCIMYFLKYNINVQSPSIRQNILGMIKNLFVRLQAVVQTLKRKKDFPEVDRYFQFLVTLQEFCLENLFEGANFTRRTLSLRILFYLAEAMREHFQQKSANIWNQQKIDVMMSVFHDNYETNKEMVIEIFKFIPSSVMREFSSISLKKLETMMTSIKPPESLTASYLVEFVTKFTIKVGDFEGQECSQFSPESYLMLTWCEKLLLHGMEIAEKSLIVASSLNPLYGQLLSIRHLTSKLDLKSLGACALWRKFFNRLILLCKRLTLVVAPVVNSSSPEGIYPKEEILNNDDESKEDWIKVAEQTTPQILLLCSWRTIKEVSLLLGDISARAPLMNEGAGLLDVEQMLGIADHFLELLSKTKHRGAFEQCFFGFSLLCARLWTCEEPELHKLPSEMLLQMITSISGLDKENNELLSMKSLCATRRSAGLPFMIQALITSELKVSTNKNFHFVMKNLIQFCRTGEYLETRTHSLNILRALVRCSDLSEAIGEYIADGIKCAILGYGAESWIERNSSTLLFSALMVRIFGVQRTKDSDELPVRNKMTGRIFFLRYPELYDFFMEQLNEAAECVQAVKMNSKLHPLLLLLIRLYPSALDGSESGLKLTGFIPIVSLCSGCVDMQTRVLSAKFIASVLSPDELVTRIVELTKILKSSEKLPANVAHGILLQILYQIRAIQVATEENFLTLFATLEEICTLSKRYQNQLISFATFLDIVIEVCETRLKKGEGGSLNVDGSMNAYGWQPDVKSNDTCVLRLNQLLDSCRSFDKSALFGLPIVSKKLVHLQIIKFELDDTSAFDFGIQSSTENTHAFQTFLNVMLLILDFDYAKSMGEEYEITRKEQFFISNLSQDRKFSLCNSMKQDKSLKSILHGVIAKHDHYQITLEALDILSLIHYDIGDCNSSTTQRLIRMALTMPEHSKNSHLKYAHHALKEENFFSTLDFEFLIEISQDASLFVKSSATDFVETLAGNLRNIESRDTIFYFAKSLLLLLMDDEQEIRERSSQIAMRTLNESDRILIPSYAQERFIEFLMDKFEVLSMYEAIVLVVLIVTADDTKELNEDIEESRVFDKNEVNIFSENFVIKRQCTSLLELKLKKFSFAEFESELPRIVDASQKFEKTGNATEIKNFLQTLHKS